MGRIVKSCISVRCVDLTPYGMDTIWDAIWESIGEYEAFASLSMGTGKIDWTITLDEQLNALPIYKDSILYFGQGPEYFVNLRAGSKKEYEKDNLHSQFKKSFPTTLHKTALAIDANTGKVLWKLKLEGGDESYVEKVMTKENMVFIKSVSGWLYAIEYDRESVN